MGLAACTESGDSSPAAAATADTQQAVAPPTGEDAAAAVTPATEPATCTTQPYGAIRTSAADIIYHNGTVTAAARHVRGQGCVVGLDVAFSLNGGCTLALNLKNDKGYWSVTSGSFTADEQCGEDYPKKALGTFELDPKSAINAAVLNPAPVAVADADSSCATSERVDLVGKLHFLDSADKEKYMDVQLTGLGLRGGVVSKATDDGVCAVPINGCPGLDCGPGVYDGMDCGGCGDGLSCVDAQCMERKCLPQGDGTTEGHHIADAQWTDSNGAKVNLHDFCFKPAVWIIKTATWCYWCAKRAPEFQALYDEYSPYGVVFMMAVGQDGAGQPATVKTAKDYKKQHGYQDGWIVVADPSWAKVDKIIKNTSSGIPTFLVLDQDLVLRYAQTDKDYSFFAESELKKILINAGIFGQ